MFKFTFKFTLTFYVRVSLGYRLSKAAETWDVIYQDLINTELPLGHVLGGARAPNI